MRDLVMEPLAPSRWLVENLDLIPLGLPVLDIACGRGRHALFLARRGWMVHAIDRNREALDALSAAARALDLAITTEAADLEMGAPDLGSGPFGAVVVFNYLYRPLMPTIVDAVAPHGVLIYETFTAGQAARGHPTNPAFLLADGELPRLIEPLEILRSREGDFDGKLVSSVVARRR
jgi:SAM-dependent methyltransferase